MSGARTYATHLAEESLGLVHGSLGPDSLPEDLVKAVSSAVRGSPLGGMEGPTVEKDLLGLLSTVKLSALEEDGFFVRKARWPGAAPFAVCLTHDVDNISRPRRHVWKTRGRFGLLDLIRGLTGVGSVYDNVSLIASREESRGFHSSFYYLTTNYPLREVKPDGERIRDLGWDIGLHGDFGTHDSEEKMQAAIARFSKAMGFRPAGVREHFLKFDFAKTWKLMDAAGFDYDTTVGTNNRLGFKIGMATPFHPPDDSWSPLRMLELPLVLMDTTLWGYLKLNEEDGLSDSLRMISAVEDVEGLFTLLWHQEAVRMKGGRVYWLLLDEMVRRGCYVGSGSEISRWWRARSVQLTKKGKLIRLGGAAPRDLVLRVSVARGRTPKVASGTVERSGDEFLVRPQGPDFKLEVD